MAKDFDLNSQRWLALVFEGKNKEYGAYVHREESSNRHLIAMAIITAVALGLIFLPGLIKSVLPAARDLGQVTDVNLSNLDLKQEVPEENQIKQIVVPPPPELKTTVAFTPPVVKKDDEIKDDELMKTQQELTETKADISVATVEGVQGGTVDIADLTEHKVVVEEKPQIFSHVEVMPQFPGGDVALLKWLTDNINYPTIAQEQGIQGRVTLRFVVKPDGSVDEVEVVKGLDPSCDKEAQRVVRKMPKWIPGKQNGNPVYVYYSLPVTFRLQNN
ncbi:MAG: TonB family protein [Candidatus Azobacteroides sp.]|nr:TonB family protein [Candidatus Azobacteroides sp.]